MKEDNNEEIANEIGDLLYHVFVLMADRGVTLDDVKEVLAGRSKKTGNLKPERKKIEQY